MSIKERPILFNGLMVRAILRAILEGRKTQTRRVLKDTWCPGIERHPYLTNHPERAAIECPYGQPGDRLWVRETWATEEHEGKVVYRATDEGHFPIVDGKWKPSIHMPRWASRILLEIVSVRVERLQDISEEDAKSEGVRWDGEYWRGGTHPIKKTDQCWSTVSDAFKALWKAINGPGSWDANPWVWVIEFKRIA